MGNVGKINNIDRLEAVERDRADGGMATVGDEGASCLIFKQGPQDA